MALVSFRDSTVTNIRKIAALALAMTNQQAEPVDSDHATGRGFVNTMKQSLDV
jgi:hypothetical protein